MGYQGQISDLKTSVHLVSVRDIIAAKTAPLTLPTPDNCILSVGAQWVNWTKNVQRGALGFLNGWGMLELVY